MKQTILVTGAFGNVGCLVIDTLLNQGHSVVAFDKKSKATAANAKTYTNKPVKVCWGDITDKSSIVNALDRVTAVIHLAAVFPPLSENQPQLTDAVNVQGTKNLVEAMESSANTKRLVFASSIGVYGKKQWQFTPPLTANDPINPDDLYGKSKAAGEAIITASSLEWSILRLAPCPPSNIKAIASFKEQEIFANHPDSRMEVIHPVDAALAFANAAQAKEAAGKILLIGGGTKNQIKYHDMINIMFTTLGIGSLPREVCEITDKVEFHGDWLDTEESQRILKYQRHDVRQLYVDFMNSFPLTSIVFGLVKLLSPVIRKVILHRSFYYQGKQAVQ